MAVDQEARAALARVIRILLRHGSLSDEKFKASLKVVLKTDPALVMLSKEDQTPSERR